MLKTTVFSKQLHTLKGGVMLLGGFDGLHLGHSVLVQRAKTHALPVGIMTIFGGKTNESVFTAKERNKIFKDAGIDFVFELPFLEIRDMEFEQFANLLMDEFAPKYFVCGEDFRFGKGAMGTPEKLEEYTRVRVEVEELTRLNGEKVSTATVKGLLSQGAVDKANILLNRPFFLLGEVVEDRKVGRMLGFPTANIPYPSDKYPLKKGVYETLVTVDKKEYRAITNFGARPTFNDNHILTETYLDGFSGDLYGQTLEIRFVRFLREIEKFDSADALKAQLNKDIRRVREHD